MADSGEKQNDAADVSGAGGGKPENTCNNTRETMEKLADLLERLRLVEYVNMSTRPAKLIYANFLAGMARGLGFGLGMTVLLGLTLYIIGRMVDLPLIGSYIADVVRIVNEELKEFGTKK